MHRLCIYKGTLRCSRLTSPSFCCRGSWLSKISWDVFCFCSDLVLCVVGLYQIYVIALDSADIGEINFKNFTNNARIEIHGCNGANEDYPKEISCTIFLFDCLMLERQGLM